MRFLIVSIFIFSSIFGQISTSIDISIDSDGTFLKGKLYISEKTGVFPTVILLPGLPGNKTDVLGIGNRLSDKNINVLMFNYSGTHQSEGKFNFENTQKDIQAAFDFIHQSENIQKYKIDTTKIVLGGYSYGGGMAITYAANHPEINSVFSVAGNDHGAFMKEYNRSPEMKKGIDSMFDELALMSEIVRFGPGGTPKEIAELKFIELNPNYDLIKGVPSILNKNILLIAGWDDINVSLEKIVLPLYRELVNNKAKNVTITAVQDNHSFQNSKEEIAQKIIEWIKTIIESNK